MVNGLLVHHSPFTIPMVVAKTIETIRQIRRESQTSWGLVPTMGFLHEGHLSLVRRAREENDWVAASIFVNPTQFAPNEDLATYPRNLERDLALLEQEGVDLVFVPDDGVMYPAGFQSTITLDKITQPLEGTTRPTHFQGVATVVAKLFNIFQPTRVYFGQKDAQQTLVIRQLIADLNFNLELVICPTIREPDGLAMSSRNAKLTPEQRQQAPILYQALKQAQEAITNGQTDANHLRHLMQQTIATAPLAHLDYISIANTHTLQELETITDETLLSLAVYFGSIRLIDNFRYEPINA